MRSPRLGGPCVALAVVAFVASGCGGDDSGDSVATTTGETTTATQKNGPVPRSLITAESAAEDLIDVALAGKRAQVVRMARKLDATAAGPAGKVLTDAGVPPDRVQTFKERAARVARLAPSAPLLDVALASNNTFALMPGFFARYETVAPASVTKLDYLDFEAKLRSRADDAPALRRTVDEIAATWASLRPEVVSAGGARTVIRYNAHVRAMNALADNANPAKAQREAQHGLDLVDRLEETFEKK